MRINRRWILAIGAILLLGVLTVGIVAVNQHYPAPAEHRYAVGENFSMGDFALQVTGYHFMDEQQIKTVFAQELANGQRMKGVLVDLTVTNTGTKPAAPELYPFVLESSAWKNGVNLAAFMQLSDSSASMSPMLQPGESCNVTLPYHMTDSQFRPEQWDEVETRSYSLVCSLYPAKISVSLS